MSISNHIELLSPNQVAEILNVTVPTLCVWRCTKRYELPYVKIGRNVCYKADDVRSFIETNTHNTKNEEK